jgi:hypothetical protein
LAIYGSCLALTSSMKAPAAASQNTISGTVSRNSSARDQW